MKVTYRNAEWETGGYPLGDYDLLDLPLVLSIAKGSPWFDLADTEEHSTVSGQFVYEGAAIHYEIVVGA